MAQQFDIVGNLLLKVDGAEAGLNKLKSSLSQLKMPTNLDSNLKKSFSNLDGLFAKYKAQLKDGFNTKGDVSAFAKTGKQIEAEYDRITATVSKLTGKDISFKVDLTTIQNLEKEIERVVALKDKLSQDIKGGLGLNDYLKAMQASDVGRRGTKVFDASNMLQTSLGRGDIEKAKTDVEGLISELNRMSDTRKKALEDHTGIAFNQIITELRTKVTDADQAMNKFGNDIKTTSDNIAQIRADGVDKVTNALNEAVGGTEKAQSGFKQLNGTAQEAANSMLSMTKQVQDLQQSTQYFFSLRNMINLLKRGIDDAVQSVKELDKAMTETAVVTDYKVSDLWGMLPEYTKVANELGATTQGAYETMTLYYQQGLDQQQAFELGAETMKMARIAGLDYAETTDMMTAALRGFNMELNETSAKRVNDVYSKLAAITASDTEELGTAMQRTASIAASAGASFEGTTAFLAQAIETTREPAENIGTAMKTIVARFQEMKKNPLEISEVEGEEVNYNKIDAALKTIGVDLKDTNGQFRDFDQVMLDISAKWDTLSQSQQRYIATTAAGSRQQSRFIAMVSNYDRTMQLMEAANNSAGASDEQFGKTMDSLESKLNQLHNAWQAFTMGIANNGMIKLAVDSLTNFLTVTNKIINTLSMGSGAIKSFLSVFAAFTGLKAAGRIANRAIGGLGGLIDPQSTFKEGFRGGAIKQGQNQAQAKAISTPIVNSLSKISGQIAAIAKTQGVKDAGQKGQSTAGTKETSKEDYKQIKQAFDKLSGKDGFKMGDASNLFKQLDEKHQYSMFKNSPGTKAAMKQASLNWIDSKGWSKEFTKEGKNCVDSIYKGMEQGKIPVSKGIALIGQPAAWGKVFGTDVAKNISSSYIDGLKTSTNQAHQEAIKYLVPNPEQAGVGSDYFKQWFASARDEQKKAYLDKFKTEKEKLDGGLGGATGTVSNIGRFANDIGAVADRFTQAGYGISAFGSLLSQLGGPIGTVGAGIQSLGGIVSSLGMSISGATGLITMFTEGVEIAGTGITIMGSTIAAVAAPIAALGAALFIAHKHFQNIKKAGEEVTNTFKETSKSIEDNIAKLKSYQSEFATLSKGVDSNGNNVNLDDSQYQRYLEIVDDIASINPDIVEGYNAQGHAIIDNNTALAETLKLQEQIKNKTYETYTSEASLQKLINARNINKDYKNIQTQENGVSMGYGHGNEGRNASNGIGKAIPLAGDVSSIADKLRLITGTDALGNTIKVDDKMLQKYGIESMDALISGEEQAVKKFIKHRDQIQADLANSGFELNESIIKGFEKLGEDSTAFDAAIQPVYDNLLANVSNSKAFESIAPEFREALNTGLKDLASQDLSSGEMIKAANNMATRFANLTTGSGKYQDALDKVEEAQQEFASTLNETEYRANVEPAIQDLIKLKQEALNEGSAYGDALAEYLENQIQRISNFTKEGGANLTEALNTATDEIAAAEGALDSFNEATKKDFSTAAEGMKGIFDKTTETFKDSYGTEIQKHAEGMGDATFWTGAEALLSGKELERLTKGKDGYEAAEAVAKKIQGLEPMLRDGQEGFDAFTDRVLENADAMDKLAEAGVTYDKESGLITNIPDDQWHNVAEALGISDDLLTSMLNKGRQFADISFMNVDEAREALATSEYTIKGTQAAAGEQQNLYVKEDTLRRELSDAGYVRKEQQDEQIAKLLNEGVKTIPADATQLNKDELDSMAKDWGVSTLPDLIQTLNETGDFTKDEIKNYADQMGLLGSDAQYDELYSSIIEAAENPELVKQTSVLETISAQVAALADTRTGKEAKEDYDKAHKELVGGKGIDTQAQAFAKGQKLDENGKLVDLSVGEYEQTKASMQEVANSFRETAAIAAEKVKTASDDEQKKYWKQVQEGAEADAARTDKYIQMADEAMKKRAEAEAQEAEGRKKEIDARNKAREDSQKQEEILRQKEAQGRQQEIDARNKAREEEQARLAAEQQEKRGEQQENYWRERGKQESQVAQVEDIQSKTDYLLQTSINTSLKTALDNLDPTQIASDPAQSQAFSNLYKDLINGTLPKPEDLQTLGIFSQLDSQYQDQITGAIEEKSSFLGEKFSAAYQAFAEADKAALAMDVVPANDNVSKVITTIGQRLKNWWDKINNVNTEVGPANVAPAVNTGAQAVVNIAKDAIQDTQSKITIDTSESEAKITNLKTLVDSTISTIQKGANFKINVKDSGLKNAAKRAESITKASGNKSINVTASGADGANKLSTAVKDFSKLNNKTINLTAKSTGLSGVQSLTNAVQAFHRLTDKTITLKTIKETITRGGPGNATGAHNHGYFSAPPKAGSAARGSYGQLGPKGKGGLTLTGELGYEIAWIPSENRSMILGANGPQMVNLPGDAVVWTHEQSKKILKQKSIPAGSHADESASIYKKKYNNNSSGGNGGNGGNTSQPKSKSKTIDRTLQKQIRQVTAEAGHVVVWWENMARRVESVQRQAEKNQKKLEGLLTKITSTTKTVNGTVKNYQKNLKTSIALNQREVLRANRELKALNTGSNKYYSQEDVSYEEKVNGKKESKEITINLDRYIKYNKLFKNYDIDWKLLEQIGTWGWYDSSGNKHAANKSLAEAIKAAAEKAINDRVSKRNTAEDNVTKAREELKKLSKDIYDTFYGWETSLTKIWNITQKIETLTTKINRLDAGTSLLEAQIGSGMRMSDASSAQTDIQLFKQRLNLQNRTLKERQKAIEQATQDVKDATSVKDENAEITTINDMLKNPKKYKLKDTDIIGLKERKKALKEQRTVITRAKKYLTTTKNADGTVNIDFNYEKLNEDRLNGKITADMAKAIEKYKDSIEEANNNLNEQRQALIEGVTEYYSTLKDLREQWADYEDQLIQITEENNKKELDQLKTLSDSVKQSLDDLLNDVKRKLDERRKQEDNANTERDISQKQQRLAMLRADTSGGHQVEIAQLEKEIAEAQQNYQRSLEDQLLEKLQNQADEAAKQRERQIELQEKIATSVNNIALVDMWMANPEQYKEEIIQAYKDAQNYNEQGIHRQSVIDTDAEEFYEGVRTNQEKQRNVAFTIDKSNDLLAQIEEDLKWVGATVENARDRKLNVKDVHEKLGASYKSLKEEGGYTIKDFFESKVSAKDARGAGFNLQELKDVGYNAQQLQKAEYTAKELKDAGFTMQDLKDVYTPSELKSAGFKLKDFEAEKFDYSSVRDAGFTVDKLRDSEVYGKQAEKDYEKIQKKYNNFLITRGAKTKKEAEKAGSSKFWGKLTSNGYNTMIAWGKQLGLTERQVATDLARTDKLTWKDVIKAAKGARRGGKRIKQWYPNAKKTGSFYKAFESVFGAGSWKKYASGGLATQTGPAWLDGTPSKPELVLSATDTKNFLALKDVLAGAMKGISNTSNTYGDILYEININVDKIEKDYDVDRVVEKVKKEITKGAGYRNVTQVRNFR